MAQKDLIPVRTEEEAKALGRKGGIASGKARKEKKRMSQIYAEFLDKDHQIIDSSGKALKLSGAELVSKVMGKVLSKGDRASVSLIKEIREGTEGSKVKIIDNEKQPLKGMTDAELLKEIEKGK